MAFCGGIEVGDWRLAGRRTQSTGQGQARLEMLFFAHFAREPSALEVPEHMAPIQPSASPSISLTGPAGPISLPARWIAEQDGISPVKKLAFFCIFRLFFSDLAVK